MRKIFLLLVLVTMSYQVSLAQQDAMFTKYMFNSLVYNPAYAGSKEHMAIGLLHRTQWWGIEGAPQTQSATIHTPLPGKRVGMGLSLVNDMIGPTHTMTANLSYAYRIPVGPGKLSIGLQGGIMNWRADWAELGLADRADEAFADDPNLWLPNFGTGLYYYTPGFYVGGGVPHLIDWDLREKLGITTQKYARLYRHYYATVGGAIRLNDAMVFKPSALLKGVGLFTPYEYGTNGSTQTYRVGAPLEFDVDLSMFFHKTLWIGASFRSSVEAFTNQNDPDGRSSFDSADIWAAWYLRNGLRIGGAFDYTLTKLQEPAQGSFEVFLGYEFNYEAKKIVTPRYF